MNSVTLPIGSISIMDKIDREYGLISSIFGKAGGMEKFKKMFWNFYESVSNEGNDDLLNNR